jgi:AcrR family transcriptional regulator
MRQTRLGDKAEETRARILEAALALFRKRGFDATTMRDVAKAADVAVGAAYYYFPSKDAIVLSYYEETQRISSARTRIAFRDSTDVRARLGAAFHAKLDVIAKDRKLLSALFKTIADPAAPMSIFSATTEPVRQESIQVLDEALSVAPEVALLDPQARRVLALAFFSLQLGVTLYFIHDASPKQEKTRALVDRSLDLLCGLFPTLPALAPLLGASVAAILEGAGLLGEPPDKE